MTNYEQLDVFDDTPGLVRNDHPDTAREAAMTVRTGTARFKVLARIVHASRTIDGAPTKFGITDEEICADAGMPPSTERPRRVECVRAGWVEPIPGETRPSMYGKAMQLWRVTDAGYAAYKEAMR